MGIVAGGLSVAMAGAQMPQLKRPEEAPTERPPAPPPKKLVNEPRAVGVLQLNNSGKGTLIPIAIRIDGKFYDASIYKADPVPMALDVGTVYEVEKTGQSEGMFTVSGALHNQNPNSATPWLGAGAYVVNGTSPASTIHKAEDKPRGLDDNNDAPPRLTREKDEGDQGSRGSGGAGGASQKASPAPSGSSQTGSGASGGSSTGGGSGSSAGSTSSSSASGDDSGRPQLKRAGAGDAGNGGGQGTTTQSTNTGGSSAQPSAGSPPGTSGTATGAAGQSGPASTAQGAQGQPSQNQGSQGQSPQGQSQNQSGQNYYRPTLRRGKPTQNAPEDTPEELTRTTETGIAKSGAAAVVAKPAIQLVPAISDAGGPLPETFQFFWKESEEGDRKKQMLELAGNSVQEYLAKLAKDTIPAIPANPAKTSGAKVSSGKRGASGHQTATKVEPEFEDVEFRAFDVWRNNQPVMILTAEAHLPEKAESAAGSSPSAVETYYVTIAARTDIYGDLRKLYAGVTDKFHLDVTPKLELIDAVDADGDGHGELLFRETTDAGNGYLIYRPTGDTLWKMFDSLNQE